MVAVPRCGSSDFLVLWCSQIKNLIFLIEVFCLAGMTQLGGSHRADTKQDLILEHQRTREPEM